MIALAVVFASETDAENHAADLLRGCLQEFLLCIESTLAKSLLVNRSATIIIVRVRIASDGRFSDGDGRWWRLLKR